MKQDYKVEFLKSIGWFYMNNKWHHPNLTQSMDLSSAWLYESFKRRDDEDERLFDDDQGV